MSRAILAATLVACVLSIAIFAGPLQNGRQAPVDFTTEIRPLLSDRCFRCHGPDASKRQKELRLDVPAGTFKTLEDGCTKRRREIT